MGSIEQPFVLEILKAEDRAGSLERAPRGNGDSESAQIGCSR